MKQVIIFFLVSIIAITTRSQTPDAPHVSNDTLYTKNAVFYPNQIIYLGKPLGYSAARDVKGFVYIRYIKRPESDKIKSVTLLKFEKLQYTQAGTIYVVSKAEIHFADGSKLKTPFSFDVNNAIEYGEIKLTQN